MSLSDKNNRWQAEYEIPLLCTYTTTGNLRVRFRKKNEITSSSNSLSPEEEQDTSLKEGFFVCETGYYLLECSLHLIAYKTSFAMKINLSSGGMPLKDSSQSLRLPVDKPSEYTFVYPLINTDGVMYLSIQFQVPPECHVELSGRVILTKLG